MSGTSTKTFDVSFAGGVAIEAKIGDHVIRTDQSRDEGGQDSGPTPFGLLMASVATCSAVYAVRFCENREIPIEGMKLRAVCEFTDKPFHMDKMTLELTLPEGFPEKYKGAILKAMNLCAVKKNIIDAPEFETVIAER
ncbi:OsmC family protein [Desulfovibrio ferrophilus]|uniref:OsmC family protein n=1 Tax=Desulfovibrio ferrophilus TaxID=241368 RepID=A0A2Z6B1V4_9BACT|nr:OsmC family protein [Desulfovibrio ferrophilus]BBD09461.1 OsmC family protein [Desulfovibrio ferrophilus]